MAKINPIIWSTNKIKKLNKQIEEKGTIPIHNPYYDNNANLKDGNLKYEYTEDELIDIARVHHDIFYFAEEIATVMTDDFGITRLKNVGGLREYQKSILMDLVNHRFNVWLASRQVGKCVDALSLIKVKFNKKIWEIPIFVLFYVFKPKKKKSILDRIKFSLYKTLHRLNHRKPNIHEFIKELSNEENFG